MTQSIEGLPTANLAIVPDHWLKELEIEDRTYKTYDFRAGPWKHEMIFAMHRLENGNNLEVLKLALYCRRRHIKMTMIGVLNQFPLFSIFADAVILCSAENYLDEAYVDHVAPQHYTCYKTPPLPESIMVTNLDRMLAVATGKEYEGHILTAAMLEVSDDEVVDAFADVTVRVRSSSYDLYHRLCNQRRIPRFTLIAELKEYCGAHGFLWRNALNAWAEKSGVRVITDRSWQIALAGDCGEHYMAVQCLGSILSGWAWYCYGGSTNIMSFFPFKLLVISDAFAQYSLAHKLSLARFGESIFPCYPERHLENLEAAVDWLAQKV